jgi:hypothetical protein
MKQDSEKRAAFHHPPLKLEPEVIIVKAKILHPQALRNLKQNQHPRQSQTNPLQHKIEEKLEKVCLHERGGVMGFPARVREKQR